MSASHRQKTVLMIAYTYYESDPRVIRQAEAAAEAGFQVDFLALRKPGTPETEIIRGVRVIRLNQAKYRGGGHLRYVLAYIEFFLRCLLKTSLLFFKREYRVIHVNNMPDFLVFSTVVARCLGARVILDIHDPMPNTFASKFNGREEGWPFRLLLWQERLSAAYCDRVLTVHEPVKNGILVRHGINDADIDVVANFADQNLFPLRETFSINGRVRFVFHGTIVERSGLRILMEALEQVRCKEKIYVKIIGEGDFSSRLADMITIMGLQSVVDFDNQTYPAHSIAERLQDSHVGLIPLEISSVTNYALPLKLLEYISMGLPVLTVRNNAIAHYMGEDDCIFFDTNDPASLARQIDWIASDPEILNKYRSRSVSLRPRFSWTGEKEKYVALLHQLSDVHGTQLA